MPSDYDDELVRQAVIHFKANEMDLARRYLERAMDIVDDEDTRVRASMLMSKLVDDPAIKRGLLETVLAYDRFNAEARRALGILDGKLNPEDIVDANELAPQDKGGVKNVQADRFTCPRCGGRMVFSADGQTLTCEYCARTQQLDAQDSREESARDFFLTMATAQGHSKPVAMHSFNCKGCGATFILPPEVISATCSYCGSAHVVSLDETRALIQPDAIIPFEFEQKTAMSRIIAWAKKEKIHPDGKVNLPRGVYMPVWTFDLGGEVPCRVEVMTNDRSDPVKVFNTTEVIYVQNIPVPGTRKFGELLRSFARSFQYRAVKTYDPRYLASWPGEVYEISMSDASLNARADAGKQAMSQAEISFLEEGTVLSVSPSPGNIAIESFRLVLVPVWVASYPCEGRLYNILVNGQTGAVMGQQPAAHILGWFSQLFK